MRKLIATIFLVTYFITSTAATVQIHYCMNKAVSWSFSADKNTGCGICGMEKQGHKGCCQDENKIIKAASEHKAPNPNFDFLKLNLNYFTKIVAQKEQLHINNSVEFRASTLVPPLLSIPIYLYNSVFRI